MGEAKRKGTFEERKKQALTAGRVKKPKPKVPQPCFKPFDSLVLALTLASIKYKGKGHKALR